MIRTFPSTNEMLSGVAKIIKKKGCDIDELFLYDNTWSLKFFVAILNDLPKLKHLIVLNTDWKTDPEDVEFPELVQLKTLQIKYSFGFGLLDCFLKSNLQTIQIRDCHIDPDSIKKLLKSQENLKTLALRFVGDYIENVQYLRILDETLPFKLTSLSLQFSRSFNNFLLVTDNLFKFIESQSQTLNSLESTGKFPNRFYELVLSKCKKLKSWRQATTDIPEDWTFKKQFEAKNITTLILVSTRNKFTIADSYPVFFEEFIRCVPNVTDLTVDDDCCNSAMKVLSSNLKQVEKLAIRGVIGPEYSYAFQFPQLHTLNIRDLIPNSSWDEFIKSSTQLKELTVNVIPKGVKPMVVIEKFIDSLKPLKLQKLCIGKRYPSIPIIQSTMKIFDGLPFRDDKLFNAWLDQEFWAEDKYFGLLKDKWVYDGRNSDYSDRYKLPVKYIGFEFDAEFGRLCTMKGLYEPFPTVDNVFAVLDLDSK